MYMNLACVFLKKKYVHEYLMWIKYLFYYFFSTFAFKLLSHVFIGNCFSNYDKFLVKKYISNKKDIFIKKEKKYMNKVKEFWLKKYIFFLLNSNH